MLKLYRMIIKAVLHSSFILILLHLVGCQKELNFEQNVEISSIGDKSNFEKIALGNGKIGVLKSKKNKDLLIFINDASQSKEEIERYIEMYYFMGFDVLIFNYGVKNKVVSLDAISKEFISIKENLTQQGYLQSRIVVFGCNRTSALAINFCNISELRGCIIENPSKIIEDKIVKLMTNLKTPILILQGEKSDVSSLITTVKYFSSIPISNKKKITILTNITDRDMFYDDEYLKSVSDFYPTLSGFNENYPSIKW